MKTHLFFPFALLYFALYFLTSCGKENAVAIIYPVKKQIDRTLDPKLPVIKIGNQTWTSGNLDVSAFRNGDVIVQAKTMAEWHEHANAMEPSWCYYNFNPENGKIYGKIYNNYAVKDPRQLAPYGYRIPGEADWLVLINHLGGEEICGKKMKSSERWSKNGNGTNESGFNGLPGGYCDSYGDFSALGEKALWWSLPTSHGRYLISDYNLIGNAKHYDGEGMYVRCIKEQ